MISQLSSRPNRTLRKLTLLLLALSLSPLLSRPLLATPVWYSDLDQAIESARSSGKPIYLHIFADWCPVCRRMERSIYPSPKVSPELEQFVTVRINGERNYDIARKFNVRGFPTLVFMDKNGYILDKVSGGMDESMFAGKLNRVRTVGNRTEEKVIQDLEKSPEGLLSHFQAGLYYAGIGDNEKGRLHFLKAWISPDQSPEDKRMEAIYNAAVSSMQLQDHVSAISQWNAFLSIYKTEDPRMIQARFYRGISLSRLQMDELAKPDLEFAQKHSGRPEIRNAATQALNNLEKN